MVENHFANAALKFEIDALHAQLEEHARQDPTQIRPVAIQLLRAFYDRAMEQIERVLEARPRRAAVVTQSICVLTDHMVQTLFWLTTKFIHPNISPTEAEKITLIALGGYGRGLMAPHSDVDLLFLIPYKISPWIENVTETMLYMLWDLKFKVGHSIRSIDDCVRLSKSDHTIQTALLEQRTICGDIALGQELHEILQKRVFSGNEQVFIEAKLDERNNRHIKQGDRRYVVEPNVKEGKGGLRDLQSLYWIAKYYHHVETVDGLVALGVLNDDEYKRFMAAEDFLWAIRCHLHVITKRANDQLTFPLQVEVAQRMGFIDTAGRRAVEHFMQEYFRHATTVGDMTRVYLTSLERSQVKIPFLEKVLTKTPSVAPGLRVVTQRLDFENSQDIRQRPLLILTLFEYALKTGLLIHPDAMRFLQSNLNLIDEELRHTPQARQSFFSTLLDHGNPERALRRMNELGILSAFIPEFAPIVAMMQFNMYHHYTVDEHTIQTISQLAQIEREELTEDLPVASSILKDRPINRKVLYTALLCHDIGKGREEDHSILGARISRKVTKRLGLDDEERATVEWLVRNHLVMSDMAQKRDISDPRTVRGFAKSVETRERLDLLTVLTVCDIRGVGPNTWNNWKATLLRQLYRDTSTVLEGHDTAASRTLREQETRQAFYEAMQNVKGWDDTQIEAEIERHYPSYWQGLPSDAQVTMAKLLRNLDQSEIKLALEPDKKRDATRICFALVDHPGIFSRLTGALSLVGANVVDARSFTSKDGYATSIFWVQDKDEKPYAATKLKQLQKTIHRTLSGDVIPKDAIFEKYKIKAREKPFRVPTAISFDNEGSDIATIIEVDTRDRPGLLHDLTRTLAAQNVRIVSVIAATYGEQVVDIFYVKDMFGLKIHSENKQRALEAKLRDAITLGAKRADL